MSAARSIEEVGEGDEESAACAFALKPPLFFPLLPLKPDASFTYASTSSPSLHLLSMNCIDIKEVNVSSEDRLICEGEDGCCNLMISINPIGI